VVTLYKVIQKLPAIIFELRQELTTPLIKDYEKYQNSIAL
jgi:hypothetical protein